MKMMNVRTERQRRRMAKRQKADRGTSQAPAREPADAARHCIGYNAHVCAGPGAEQAGRRSTLCLETVFDETKPADAAFLTPPPRWSRARPFCPSKHFDNNFDLAIYLDDDRVTEHETEVNERTEPLKDGRDTHEHRTDQDEALRMVLHANRSLEEEASTAVEPRAKEAEASKTCEDKKAARSKGHKRKQKANLKESLQRIQRMKASKAKPGRSKVKTKERIAIGKATNRGKEAKE